MTEEPTIIADLRASEAVAVLRHDGSRRPIPRGITAASLAA